MVDIIEDKMEYVVKSQKDLVWLISLNIYIYIYN